jgi:hypothetical protein
MHIDPDISWGSDCEGCGCRLNAGRAQEIRNDYPNEPIICGSCRDEIELWRLRDEIRTLKSDNFTRKRAEELQAILLPVFKAFNLDVAVGLTQNGICIYSQTDKVNVENIGILRPLDTSGLE